MRKGERYIIDHEGWRETITIISSGPRRTTYEYKWRGKDWHRDGVKCLETDKVRSMIGSLAPIKADAARLE